MYEEQNKTKGLTEKHVQIADEMANGICNFSPGEQNEIVRIIYDTVFQNRQARIDEAEKNFIHLKDTLRQLQGNENK